MQRYFEISIHALIITAFVALAATGRLDSISIVVFASGVVWSLYRTIRQLPPALSVRATLYLASFYIVFFFVDAALVSGSFIPATVHMVLFLELAKLHQQKADRDYFYLIILAFLMILASASLTIDISFIITLFLFLISLVATLMSFEIVRSQRSAPRETRIAVSLTGISGWATAWIVILGGVIFFLVPRVGTGYFSRATVPPVLQSGFSDNVKLGEIGKIKLSTGIVMRVKRAGGRVTSGMKWRGIALDRFDGQSWHKSDMNRFSIRPSEGGLFTIELLEHKGDGVRYDILQEPLGTSTLFGPYRVVAVTSRLESISTDNDDSIFSRIPQQRRVQYQVLSEIPNRTRVDDYAPPQEALNRYLQLPDDLDRRVIELALDITRAGTSPIEKASLIEAYLRKNFHYTLELTWNPGPQPLNTFLFDVKNGHCEYFASAMAILARAAGIPTRLVNGFQMGEFNPVGSDYIVRESDAHSWVEAYIPGRGWTEFDATPPDMRPAGTDLSSQLSHYMDAAELVWSSYILVYDSDSQSQLFRSAQERVQTLQMDFRNGSDKWSSRIKVLGDQLSRMMRESAKTLLFWIIVLLLGSAWTVIRYRRTFRTHWQIWNLRKGKGTTSRDVIEYMFLRAAKLAQHRKPARLPAQTWREWALGLPDAERRSLMMVALEVFEKSIYSRDPVSRTDFTAMENAIRGLKG